MEKKKYFSKKYILGCAGSKATLTIGTVVECKSIKLGHATVLDSVADFKTWFCKPLIPENVLHTQLTEKTYFKHFYKIKKYEITWKNIRQINFFDYISFTKHFFTPW